MTDEQVWASDYLTKTTLINEDPVTCSLYFNKLVNVIISILQSPKYSPFGKDHILLHYFKKIEFQHRGSPHAHILIWLKNAKFDGVFGADYDAVINLINKLISVSADQASGHINLQTHHHTFTCYKKINPKASDKKCRFEAPFLPSRSTIILTPMAKEDRLFKEYRALYSTIKKNLEFNDYKSIDDFYKQNNITSDEMYKKILTAGINRPRVFLKRLPSE